MERKSQINIRIDSKIKNLELEREALVRVRIDTDNGILSINARISDLEDLRPVRKKKKRVVGHNVLAPKENE